MTRIANAASGRLVSVEKGKFWEWSIEGATVTTTGGNVGKAGRKTSKAHPSTEKAASDLESKHHKKLREGFRLLAGENPGPVALQIWLSGEYTGFAAIDIDSQSNRIATCRHIGQGGRSCEIVIIDADTGDESQVIRIDEFDVSTIRFHHGNLVIQSDDRVSSVDLDTETVTRIGEGGVFSHLQFDLQGDRLLFSRAGSDGPVIVVGDLATGQTLLELDAGDQRHVTDHHVSHVGALSPSGKLAAICRRPGEIELYDLKDGTNSVIRGDFPCASKLQFHPSEQWLGLAELYGEWRFRLWSLKDNQEDDRFGSIEYTFPDGSPRPGRECYDFSFDPSGKFLTLRDREWLRVQDFQSGASVMGVEQRHVVKSGGTSGFVMDYASDGRIVTRTDRGVITLYDLTAT